MRALLRSMQPDTFEDISAVGALYRPGPMGADSHNKYARRKTGREPVEPIHPELADALEDVLGETYGLIVYQEQVMAIAQKLAGYTLGQADLLRRAMGKKKKEELDKQFAAFSAGMTERGYSDAAITTLWDILLPFSDYAFNKAHSAAYGVVSYWTAYLKANYPAEYMAALLTCVRDDKDKSAIYLNECRRMGIKVLPPDVNESAADFTPVGTDIRFGLAAVRNVGHNVVDGDRARPRGARAATATSTTSSARSGSGLQQAGHRVADQGRRLRLARPPRRALLVVHARGGRRSTPTSSTTRRSASTRLFGGLDDRRRAPAVRRSRWRCPTSPSGTRRRCSPSSARCSASTSPTTRCSASSTCWPQHADCTVGRLLADEERADGAIVTIGGLITSVNRQITKKGDAWASITVEDLEGAHRGAALPEQLPARRHAARPGHGGRRQGPAEPRQGHPELMGQEVTAPDVSEGPTRPRRHLAALDPVHHAGRRLRSRRCWARTRA